MKHFKYAAILLCVLFPVVAYAGDLDSPAAPGSADSAMFTLEDIYNRLDAGTTGSKHSNSVYKNISIKA
ncbi:exported hypothetical protein [Candidatus Magnetomoraceae bacterium gMMP-15]